jgi:hypothetical protein
MRKGVRKEEYLCAVFGSWLRLCRVVDASGMAVALTSTVNGPWGALFSSPSTGLLFNNEMDDFSRPDLPNDWGLAPSGGLRARVRRWAGELGLAPDRDVPGESELGAAVCCSRPGILGTLDFFKGRNRASRATCLFCHGLGRWACQMENVAGLSAS